MYFDTVLQHKISLSKRIWIMICIQTHCQLLKFTVRDSPFNTKFTSLVNTRGLTNSASLKNRQNKGRKRRAITDQKLGGGGGQCIYIYIYWRKQIRDDVTINTRYSTEIYVISKRDFIDLGDLDEFRADCHIATSHCYSTDVRCATHKLFVMGIAVGLIRIWRHDIGNHYDDTGRLVVLGVSQHNMHFNMHFRVWQCIIWDEVGKRNDSNAKFGHPICHSVGGHLWWIV